jgi:outer membrane protein insertion porin family
LRVKFGEPAARLASGGAGCGANAVAVSIPVEEGLQYDWGGATWSGDAALAPAELDAALGLKAGEVANELKIEKSLREVERAYGRKGYLTAAIRPAQDFDDATRRVTYRFDVREGPRYRMGALNIEGLNETEAARVRALWQLKPGEIFDQSYAAGFAQKAIAGIITPGRRVGAGANIKPNAQAQTADVTITFRER